MISFLIKRQFLLFFCVIVSIHLRAQVQINEACSSNDSILADNFGEYDDWIELHNTSNSSINLQNYYLSDDPLNTLKHKIIGSINIPANGYVVLWADSDILQGFDHLDFKLSSSGDDIILSNPSGSIVDQISLPPLITDHSYGRLNEASNEFYTFINPTPNQSNTNSTPSLTPPTFSMVSGKYSNSISVSINAEANTTIR